MPHKLNTIRQDLRITAMDLESVMRDMAGHLEYLQHSVHQRDVNDLLSQVQGLGSSINELRRVADSILVSPGAHKI